MDTKLNLAMTVFIVLSDSRCRAIADAYQMKINRELGMVENSNDCQEVSIPNAVVIQDDTVAHGMTVRVY